jgi:hypothetical protein
MGSKNKKVPDELLPTLAINWSPRAFLQLYWSKSEWLLQQTGRNVTDAGLLETLLPSLEVQDHLNSKTFFEFFNLVFEKLEYQGLQAMLTPLPLNSMLQQIVNESLQELFPENSDRNQPIKENKIPDILRLIIS